MESIRFVESLNKSLHFLMDNDPSVYMIGEDIEDPYGGAFKVTKGLSSKYPERVLTTPISEAGFLGFATGMAMNGFKPIVEIMFGDFLTLCADQIINGLSKFHLMYGEKIEIPIIIRAPMGGYRGYGPTHSQSLETLFLGVPGVNIVCPSHYHNPGKILIDSQLNQSSPILFIENKSLYAQKLKLTENGKHADPWNLLIIDEYDKSYPTISLKIDKDCSSDVTLITYGGVSSLAVEAAFEAFIKTEINVEVLIVSSVKPIPIQDLMESIQDSGQVIIVEEGIRTSGWGSELASIIYEKSFSSLKSEIKRIGALDLPIPSSKSIENTVLPQKNTIKNNILEFLI